MARHLLAGMTDYSHQTFEDMMGDLCEWVTSLDTTTQSLNNGRQQLEENGYWRKVNIDVMGTLSYAMKFFITSRTEIAEIIKVIQSEVEGNHVARICSLARTAGTLNKDIGKVWHQHPWNEYEEYGNPDFSVVVQMYHEARGMAADMIDMSNLAARLEDFVGMKKQAKNQANSGNSLDSLNVHPNIRTLITRMNDSLSRNDFSGVLHASASVFETLAKDVVGTPGVQGQTLKGFFERYRKDSLFPDKVLDFILSIYELRNTTPLAGHGSTNTPTISKEEAVALAEMTLALVKTEYKLRR